MSKPKYWACTCCSENCLLVTSGEPLAACILDPDDTGEVPWKEITRDEFQRRDDLVNDPSYIAQTMGDVPSKEIRGNGKIFIDESTFWECEAEAKRDFLDYAAGKIFMSERPDQHINAAKAAINSKSRGVVTKRWAVPGLVPSDEIRDAIDEGFEQMYKAFETSRINWLMRDWRLEFIGEDPND